MVTEVAEWILFFGFYVLIFYSTYLVVKTEKKASFELKRIGEAAIPFLAMAYFLSMIDY